jgi:hypothetical protein
MLVYNKERKKVERVVVIHTPKKKRFKPARLLLLVPFLALCWPAFYNLQTPELLGIPFFYWFQMLWIVVTSLLTAIVYLLDA